tara:strand:+ start:1007 stop:2365 length:1359 start_codon:yes stop_codon:yes gene_type:complete
MRTANSPLKVVLAVLSLLMTVFLWVQGLQQSLNRPSFTPQLSLRQQEISVLAAPAIPDSLRVLLVGNEPEKNLQKSLEQISGGIRTERQRILLASLDQHHKQRLEILDGNFNDKNLNQYKDLLIASNQNNDSNFYNLKDIKSISDDSLINQLVCKQLLGDNRECIDNIESRSMFYRLLFNQVLPIIATLIGSILLINSLWNIIKNKSYKTQDIQEIPLSIFDMIILIAGGFVVLGEVVLPSLIIPLTTFLIHDISSPLNESIKVFIGYCAMSLPPLLIFRQQTKVFRQFQPPKGGWLQWKINPPLTSILLALRGWLMVMPLVLLSGLITNVLVGNQGGSNPLLDLVLKSHDPISLFILLITTVILAPLFEEFIFRGILLPVLVNDLGQLFGVSMSALVFALAHLSIGELLPLFVLGLGLGVLRLTSGRLLPSVLMHSLWNGITFTNLILLGG